MKQHTLSIGAVAFGAVMIGGAAWADCGPIKIASMTWQSAEVTAELDKMILENGYGCDVEIVPGDTVPSLTSIIEKQSPDVIPEGWVSLQPELVSNGEADGRIKLTVDVLSDGGVNGWWIPKYTAEAHPEIKSIPDALDHPELFPAPEDPSTGAVFNGPQGWGSTLITSQMFKAYGGVEKGFVLVDPGSAAGLDGAIARAYERHEPIITFYWAPTAILGKYPMVRLDFAAPKDDAEWARCMTVEGCPDPKPGVWPADRVATVLSSDYYNRAEPEVLDYFKSRSWSNETVSTLLSHMTDVQATGEDGARYFLMTYPDVWKKWVTPEAAEKIEASLK
jgi:glycine betaine/proline transport system substrate-binding protein